MVAGLKVACWLPASSVPVNVFHEIVECIIAAALIRMYVLYARTAETQDVFPVPPCVSRRSHPSNTY